VYLQELPAPASGAIVGVATAVPLFVGYTEKGPALQAVPLNSMAAFEQMFGGPCRPEFDVVAVKAGQAAEFEEGGVGYVTVPRAGSGRFLLYDSMRLFFANGGGQCGVISVGGYRDASGAVKPVALGDLMAALDPAAQWATATMLAAPDAVLLPSDGVANGVPSSSAFLTLTKALLEQAGTLGSRMAIVDVYGADALGENSSNAAVEACVQQFQAAMAGLGVAHMDFGAAYFPWLECTVVEASEVQQPDAQAKDVILRKLNRLPPSAAMAGVWGRVDATDGVWKAPANVAPEAVTQTSVPVNDAEQAGMNAPANGIAVNAIRQMPMYGTLVWGARTMAGNSDDWRYINVRRLFIYIEQSLKNSLQWVVFEPNDARLWAAVTRDISAFLTTLWQQGALFGDKASEAFYVRCGLGSTMTQVDVTEGVLRITLGVAPVYPAEFVELSIQQRTAAA
jgi:hypothetical protein